MNLWNAYIVIKFFFHINTIENAYIYLIKETAIIDTYDWNRLEQQLPIDLVRSLFVRSIRNDVSNFRRNCLTLLNNKSFCTRLHAHKKFHSSFILVFHRNIPMYRICNLLCLINREKCDLSWITNYQRL